MNNINESFLVIDVESDGPCPGLYSMISLGAITWSGETFYEEFAPISDNWVEKSLAISNISREEHLLYQPADFSTNNLYRWLTEQKQRSGRLTMWSDNPAYDWQWVNYYLHYYCNENPLGFSARRIGDYFSGTKGDVRKASNWKKLRKTKHSHDPLDDARGNMEALKTILKPRKT